MGQCDSLAHAVYEAGAYATIAQASEAFVLYVPAAAACVPRGSGYTSGWKSTYFSVPAAELLNSGTSAAWVAEEQQCTWYGSCTTPSFVGPLTNMEPPAGQLTHLALGSGECYWYEPNTT